MIFKENKEYRNLPRRIRKTQELIRKAAEYYMCAIKERDNAIKWLNFENEALRKRIRLLEKHERESGE